MSIDSKEALIAVAVTFFVILAYLLGEEVGERREQKRAERARRNLAKSRRAS